MKKLVFGLLSLTLLATACKKSKDAPAITKENIAGTYKITGEVYQLDGQAEEDWFASAPACEKDDLEKFILDGTFQHVDAGTACDPATDGQSTWLLDGSTLTLSETAFTVSKFDGSILELTESDTSGGVHYTHKVTLKRQ